jgi:hypothetical protein
MQIVFKDEELKELFWMTNRILLLWRLELYICYSQMEIQLYNLSGINFLSFRSRYHQ